MNISMMPDGKLEQLYRYCIEAIIHDRPTKQRAEGLIAEINMAWQSRLNAVLAGTYKAESPDHGVLKTIGYQVGNDGVALAKRRVLLDFVMMGQLPFVGSPAHMLEWAEPLSAMRYRKLHRVLTGWRTGARTRGDRERAVEDWTRDLEYIEQVWKSKAR